MFMRSLITKSTVDPELFPLLTIRSCISEAEESANGPRFCAQDNLTGCAYEVRCVRLPLSQPSSSLAPGDVVVLRKQQERLDAIMAASGSSQCPPSVAFPIDVYIQEQPSSAATYVAAVDAFAGLSLGDLVRSGWSLMEESVFLEILSAVEQFGYAAAHLPPHGNLCADALKQLLTVRDGAAEAEKRSRWVVGDWRLLYDESLSTFDPIAFISDVEWMLHSAFSQLSIASAVDGSYLASGHVERAISDVVERIREHLLLENTSVPHPAPAMRDPARKLSVSSQPDDDVSPTGVSSSADAFSMLTTSPPGLCADGLMGADERGEPPSSPRPPSPHQGDTARHSLPLTQDLSLRDRIAHHQAELRKEQQLANKYRRRHAPLPPLPAPPLTLSSRFDYEAVESAEYELHYLTSPLRPEPSQLLAGPSPAALGSSAAPRQRSQSAPATRSARRRGVPSTHTAGGELHGGTAAPSALIDREVLLECVISLALVTQQASDQRAARLYEEERQRRELLQAALARTAAAAAAAAVSRPPRLAGSPSPGGTRLGATARALRGFSTPRSLQPPSTMADRLKVGGARRRPSQLDGSPASRLHAQSSSLSVGLGPSTLVQVSHSTAAAGGGGGGSKQRDERPVIDPLPLAALLAGRQAGREVPPQHSVRTAARALTPTGTTRAARGRSPPRTSSGAQTARETVKSSAAAGTVLGVPGRAKSAAAVPSATVTTPAKLRGGLVLSSHRVQAPQRRDVGGGSHAPSPTAHPHALSAGGGAAVQRQFAVAGTRSSAAVIKPGREVRLESPRVTTTPRTHAAGVPQVAPTAVEGHPISPRSPRALQQQQQQQQQQAAHVTQSPRETRPSTRPVLADRGKSSGPRLVAPAREERRAVTKPQRSSSAVEAVLRRPVQPVHEASIGITHRRARAGLGVSAVSGSATRSDPHSPGRGLLPLEGWLTYAGGQRSRHSPVRSVAR